jgi:hypothetical protein
LSSNSIVQAGALFTVNAGHQGLFVTSLEKGAVVKAGDQIGSFDGDSVTAPADATVVDAANSNTQVPQNYPLFHLSYTGFSLSITATRFVQTIGSTDGLHAKYQIDNGPGPSDCLGVFPVDAGSASMATTEDGGIEGTSTDAMNSSSDDTSASSHPADGNYQLVCLVPLNSLVRSGMSGTIVVTAAPVSESLLLPVTAVAGRVGEGVVTVIADGKSVETQVKLGSSDGARIVIVDGLQEGDVVSSLAPNLSAKKMP